MVKESFLYLEADMKNFRKSFHVQTAIEDIWIRTLNDAFLCFGRVHCCRKEDQNKKTDRHESLNEIHGGSFDVGPAGRVFQPAFRTGNNEAYCI